MIRQHRRPQAIPHRSRADKAVRATGYLLAAVIVLGSATYLLASAVAPRVVPATTDSLDIVASMSGFSQNEVRVKRGVPVTIRLTSVDNRYHPDGGGQHQWAVDKLGLNLIAPPMGSNTITFTPDAPGVYTFYCDVCCGGRENPAMQGTLLVEV
jgi:cytochrome c oxidase subunit II